MSANVSDSVFGLLRRVGTGERVLKTSLAAGLAWYFGTQLPDATSPYLASLAALLTMQITIADSISAAIQRVLGIIVGVIVAIAISSFVGISGFTVGLLVLVSFAIGAALRLGEKGIQQVAISAMLLVALGSSSSLHYATNRVVETIIGVTVGLVVNAVFAPPSLIVPARKAVQAHADAVAATLDRLAQALRTGITSQVAQEILDESRATDQLMRKALAAVEKTNTALMYNLWARNERPVATHLSNSLRTQERVAMQARGIIRTVDEGVRSVPSGRPAWLEPNAYGGELPAAIDGIGALLRDFPAVMLATAGSAEVAEFGRQVAVAAGHRAKLGSDPDVTALVAATDSWVPLGSILADLDRIRRELAGAVDNRYAMPVPPATAPSDVRPGQAAQ